MTAIAELLKDSAYKLGQFKPAQIAALESSITLKESGKKAAPYVTCLVRGKPIKLTPEEAVRQLYVMVLRHPAPRCRQARRRNRHRGFRSRRAGPSEVPHMSTGGIDAAGRRQRLKYSRD